MDNHVEVILMLGVVGIYSDHSKGKVISQEFTKELKLKYVMRYRKK